LVRSEAACLASAAFILFLCVFEGLYLRCGLVTVLEWLRRDYDTVNLLIAAFYSAIALYLSFLFVLGVIVSRWPYNAIYLAIFAVAATVRIQLRESCRPFYDRFRRSCRVIGDSGSTGIRPV
jgi:hypothetical protein